MRISWIGGCRFGKGWDKQEAVKQGNIHYTIASIKQSLYLKFIYAKTPNIQAPPVISAYIIVGDVEGKEKMPLK